MKKTGRFVASILLACVFAIGRLSQAADIQFSASVDRQQVSLDESVALKLQIETSGRGGEIEELKYSAKDFEEINEYQQNFFNSTFVNGRMESKQGRTITKVLRPRKTGELQITQISVKVNGQKYNSPDLTVSVVAAGQGTPPVRAYGNGSGGQGLRGSGRRNGSASPMVFIRAEVDKNRVFKGEQLIVSYYLYNRVRMMNVAPDLFPQLTGFLREELEMPIASGRVTAERVVVEGVAYERALLVRYAAYPLQTGKLRIDSMGVKYSYIAGSQGHDNEDEDLFMGLFNQMTPRGGNARSEGLSVEVLPLPEEGKPKSFTGAVGDFQVTATADKSEVRANEAVTVTVKVEGRGNLAAIGQPKVELPANVELYDSKGKTQTGRGSVGSKIFELLLIPRAPGEFVVPVFEFSYFDPSTKLYQERKTLPIPVRVLDPAPGSALLKRVDKGDAESKGGASGGAQMGNPDSRNQGQVAKETNEAVAGFQSVSDLEQSGIWGSARAGLWKFLYWATAGLALALILAMAWGWTQGWRRNATAGRERREQKEARGWKALSKKAEKADALSKEEVLELYAQGVSSLLGDLDRKYQIRAKSQSRSDLGRVLVEDYGLDGGVWQEYSQLLEYAENLRFSISSGLVSEQDARSQLKLWIQRAEAATKLLHKS